MNDKGIPTSEVLDQILKDPESRHDFYTGLSHGKPFTLKSGSNIYRIREPQSFHAWAKIAQRSKPRHSQFLSFFERVRYFRTKKHKNVVFAFVLAVVFGVCRDVMSSDFPCLCSHCVSNRHIEKIS